MNKRTLQLKALKKPTLKLTPKPYKPQKPKTGVYVKRNKPNYS